MKKFFFTLSATLFAILLGGLYAPLSDNASAISDYDNTIATIDTLEYTSGTCGNNGLTDSAQVLVDQLRATWSGGSQDPIDDLITAINNGDNLAISQSTDNGFTFIRWSTLDNFVLTWSEGGGTEQASLINIQQHIINFSCSGLGTWSANYAGEHTTNHDIAKYATSTDTYLQKVFLYRGDTNYPVGYEGELIPSTGAMPDVPDWYPVNAIDWEVIIADENFFTTNSNYPFLCDDDLAPSIIVEIYQGDDTSGTLIDSGEFNASSEFRFKAEKVESEQDFHLRGKYNCGTGDTHQFNQWGTANFSIGKHGTLSKAEHILNCFSDDFPFININDCFAEVNSFMAMLAFRVPDENEVAQGAFTNLQTGCRELQIFDEWLHLQNATVCPMFPSNIRNIITPFITFLMGLLAVTFIYKRQGIRSVD